MYINCTWEGPNKTDSIVERDGEEFLDGRDLIRMMMTMIVIRIMRMIMIMTMIVMMMMMMKPRGRSWGGKVWLVEREKHPVHRQAVGIVIMMMLSRTIIHYNYNNNQSALVRMKKKSLPYAGEVEVVKDHWKMVVEAPSDKATVMIRMRMILTIGMEGC